MSALWAICPQCGPICTILPQGSKQFELNLKCSCGIQVHHKENGNPAAQDYYRKLAEYKGKIPAQTGGNGEDTRSQDSCSIDSYSQTAPNEGCFE